MSAIFETSPRWPSREHQPHPKHCGPGYVSPVRRKLDKEEIWVARESGETFSSIAKRAGVTSARIRDIYLAVSRKKEREAVHASLSVMPIEEIKTVLISDLQDYELSVRTYRCLIDAGIKTMAEAADKTDEELLSIPNFGLKSLRELRKLLGPAPVTKEEAMANLAWAQESYSAAKKRLREARTVAAKFMDKP